MLLTGLAVAVTGYYYIDILPSGAFVGREPRCTSTD
jgi:hypothetical protein